MPVFVPPLVPLEGDVVPLGEVPGVVTPVDGDVCVTPVEGEVGDTPVDGDVGVTPVEPAAPAPPVLPPALLWAETCEAESATKEANPIAPAREAKYFSCCI